MIATVDTNVLVYASDTNATEHGRAIALLEHLAAGPSLVVLFWPTIMGFIRVATHPSVYPAPLTHEQAVTNVEDLLQRTHIRAFGESEGFWDAYKRVSGPVRPRGNLVPDAHLVALMHHHGVSRIWSRDRDLRKFDGITVSDPFDAKYRDGFGRSS